MVTRLRTQTEAAVAGFGRYCLLLSRALRSAGDLRLYYRNLLDEMVETGIASLPIVGLAIGFSGAVTTVQAIYQLENPLLPPSIVGAFVAPSIILELGALVSAFILTARVGARIAAELGTMRVTEQIDALEAMGLDSVAYLVLPRVIAGVLMFPVLYVIVCTIGIAASAAVAHFSGALTADLFIVGARQFFRPYDVFFGFVKSLGFGFVITSVACYKGYHTRGGAEGVGRSTTSAAVASCVFILLVDYIAAVVLL